MANLTPTAVSKSSNFVTGPSGDRTNDVLTDLLANRTEIYSNLTSIADEFYGATPPANPNVGRKWRCSTTAGSYVANTTYRWNGSAWAVDVAETVSVPQRNCVLEGPVNSAGATILFSVGTGLTVDLKATVRLSFANGFTDEGGASDYFESITSDDAAFWSSLPINSTVQLYIDRDSGGTVTGGYSTLAPVYQRYAPTHSAGLNWFDTNTQKMFVSNGSAWTQVWRVFVGTATTNGTQTTAISVNINNSSDVVKATDIITKGPWVDVRAFGAKGDGVTDDTAAIQAAIDSLRTDSNESSGGTVMFPKGRYLLSAAIEINGKNYLLKGFSPESTIIDGKDIPDAGHIISFTGNVPASGNFNFFGMENLSIRDMSNSGAGRKTLIGLDLNYCQKGLFVNCYFKGLNKGVRAYGNSHWNNFINCQWLLNSVGVALADGSAVGDGGGANCNTFISCLWAFNGTSSIDCAGTSGTTIVGGDIEGFNGTAKFGSCCNVDTRVERNLQATWVEISGDRGDFTFEFASSGGVSGLPALKITGNHNTVTVGGSLTSLINSDSTGKNNTILVKNIGPLVNYKVAVLPGGNSLVGNAILKTNLIANSCSLDLWTVVSGTATFLRTKLADGQIAMRVTKTSAGALELSNIISGTFAAGSVVFVRLKYNLLAGAGFQFYCPQAGAGGNIVLTAAENNMDSVLALKFATEQTDPTINLYISGVAGSALNVSNIAVQTELGPTMQTLDTPNVEFDFMKIAAPTTGTWMVGDKIYNSTPTAAGYIGWVCVTAGTPGTWKGFGVIQS